MADSVIRVSIIGDVKKLQGALKQGERDVGGFATSVNKLLGAAALAGGAAAVTDFAQTALGEADRLGDAIDRLEGQLGPDLAAVIDARSSDFHNLGQSRQDILELAAAFTDTATALGIGKEDIAAWADDAAAIAAALELQGVGTAAGNIDLIGKAAAGGEKALRALGLNLTDAEVEARALAATGKTTAESLTEGELAAAAYELVLEKLQKRLGDTTTSSNDLEQSQAELQARWETLTGRIGQHLEGPLNDLLAWILAGIDGLERMGEFVDVVRREMRDAIPVVYSLTDAISGLVGWLWDLLEADDSLFQNGIPVPQGGGATDFNPGGQFNPTSAPATVNVNVQGGNPADVEEAIQKALKGFSGKNGTLYPD